MANQLNLFQLHSSHYLLEEMNPLIVVLGLLSLPDSKNRVFDPNYLFSLQRVLNFYLNQLEKFHPQMIYHHQKIFHYQKIFHRQKISHRHPLRRHHLRHHRHHLHHLFPLNHLKNHLHHLLRLGN